MTNITTPPTTSPGSTDRRPAAVAGVLFVGVCAGCWFSYDPLWIARDATEAMSVARHLLDGEGIKTSIIYYEEQYATGQVPAPQTVFPPGYPVLIAAVTSLGVPLPEAAYVIASLCFAVIAILILWMARRLGQPLGVATLLAVCWCGCLQCWNNTWVMMSEMPFILLTLLSLLLFPTGADRRLRWVFLSGGAAAAAFTIRYAGVFWFITVAGYYGAELIRRRQWTVMKAALTWGSMPMVVLSGLFWRNQALSGEWTGGNPLSGQHSFSFSLWEMYQSIALTLGMAKSRLLAGGGAELLALAAVSSFLLWLVIHRRAWRVDRAAGIGTGVQPSPGLKTRFLDSGNLPTSASALRKPGFETGSWTLLSAGYVLITIALLLYLNTRAPIGMGPRKLLPLLPFALLLLARGMMLVSIDNGRARRQVAPIALLLSAALVWGQVNVWTELTTRPCVTATIAETLQSSVGSQTLREMLAREMTEAAPLLTNEPHYVNDSLERPVLGLPGPDYTDRIWTEEQVRRIVDAYSVRHVTVFPEILAEATFRPPFFEQLAAGQVPGWLRLVHGDDQLQLFVVTEPPRQREDSSPPPQSAALSRVSLEVPPPKDAE